MPENFVSQTGTVGYWSTNAPDDFDYSGDEDGRFPVSRLRQQYVDFLSANQLSIEESKQARHYYHGAQWTPEEIEILRKRRQPIITINRVGRKIDQIVGLITRIRQDPKAYPTNPRNANGAEIATQAVRTVLDANNWEYLDSACARQAAIEGIGGLELKLIQGDHGDPDVGMSFVFGDDYFHDPRSFLPDFSDARYEGIAKWLDVEAAVELFPYKEDELRTLMVEAGFDLTTHADREFKWIYPNEKRLRLVEHWYKNKGKWFWSFYCSMIELAHGESPFLDERQQSISRFIMFSNAIDHDGDRYGFVRNMKGPQDEINQRRSKALWMSNVTAFDIQKGAVDNVETARREAARPDGVIEYNMGFNPPQRKEKSGDLQAQLALLQDARSEIESFANITPDLIGSDRPGDHSGVAINMLQKAGIAELGSFLICYKDWKKRVYKAVWNIVQHNWQTERWIRVTDNQGLAQFIQVNGIETDEYGAPVIVNAIGALNVEITLDEGPDEANLMQDAYDVLKQYPPGTIPPAVLIELSPLSSTMKQRVQQLMQQQPDPQVMQQKQLMNQRLAAEIDEKNAGTMHRKTQALRQVAGAAKDAASAHVDLMSIERDNWLVSQQGAPAPAQPPGQVIPPWLPNRVNPMGQGGQFGGVPAPQGQQAAPQRPPLVPPQGMPGGAPQSNPFIPQPGS
jgi:hypothetical protein